MLRKLRTLLTALVLASLTAISLGAAAVVYIYRLPDPEIADGEGLFRWLVTRDVRNESRVTQQKLLRRLEAELHSGIEDVDRVKESLDATREAQLRKNLEYMGNLWFRERAAAYARTPEGERNAFIDDQIAQLQNLGTVYQSLSTNSSKSSGSRPGDLALMLSLMKIVNAWIEAAEPADKAQMHQFFGAVQSRVLARRFGLGRPGA